MSGMVVQLKGGDARIRVVATGEAGDYAFTGLVPGGYVVSVVPQGNWGEATANVPIDRTEVTRNLVVQPKNHNARLQLSLGALPPIWYSFCCFAISTS